MGIMGIIGQKQKKGSPSLLCLGSPFLLFQLTADDYFFMTFLALPFSTTM